MLCSILQPLFLSNALRCINDDITLMESTHSPSLQFTEFISVTPVYFAYLISHFRDMEGNRLILSVKSHFSTVQQMSVK